MEKGIKNDFKDHKLRWDLLPLQEIEDIVKVYTAGATKYGPNNWQHLEDGYNRYKAAMFRHLLEYEKGHEFDEETKCRHLAQVAWNAIAMLYLSKHRELKQDPVANFSKENFGPEKEYYKFNTMRTDKKGNVVYESYVNIPAYDIDSSDEFYEKLFHNFMEQK